MFNYYLLLLLLLSCLHVRPWTTCAVPRRGHRSPGTGATDGCEPPYGFWESNLVTQEEQTMLLTTETSLPKYAFKFFIILLYFLKV